MAVEIFVPGYEKQQRTERFWAFDSISGNAPQLDRSRGDFQFTTASLAGTIARRSTAGDAVCRVIEQCAQFGAGAPIAVHVISDQTKHYLALEQKGNIFDCLFSGNYGLTSLRYTEANNLWAHPETIWQAFSTGVLELVRDDLIRNRDRWVERLTASAKDYYAKVDEISPRAADEVKKLVSRLEERASDYGNGDLYIFGTNVDEGEDTNVGGKKVVELRVAMPELGTVMDKVLVNYDYEYGRAGVGCYVEGPDFQPVCDMDFGDFVIKVSGYGSRFKDLVKIGLNKVEQGFSRILAGESVEDKDAVLYAYSNTIHPCYFGFENIDAEQPLI